jgi:alanine racemase
MHTQAENLTRAFPYLRVRRLMSHCPCADELAEMLGTIDYEIVSAISRRVPRVVA